MSTHAAAPKSLEARIEAMMDQVVDATPLEELKTIAHDNLGANLAGMNAEEQIECLEQQLKSRRRQ
jgi:hypothetical protein